MEEYMPPTDKIPYQNDKEYHVFLSFRGKDVRNTLAGHLYEALTTAGLHVYKDDEKLEKGAEIWPSLERAIKSSDIRIPIFSKGYADSVWCLREAAAMVTTKVLIIPLFYGVDPTDVRYPQRNSSPYNQAFLKHYSHSNQCHREEIEWWKYGLQQICPCLKLYGHSVRYQREEIDGWKAALEKICCRSGWSMDTTGGLEARLVKRVVNDVIKTLDRVPLEVAKRPVGLESMTKYVILKFKLNSEEGVVKSGILGIGGIGKTTLAKALYNHVRAHFDAASCLFNVRATAADSKGLTNLQKKILKDLCNYGGEVDSVHDGIALFRDRLRGKCVLLILDDVDAKEQSDALVGDWLAPGSRVIITSRDKHILHVAGVSSECIHEMTGLQRNEGLQLFSWHAFMRPSPSPTHEDLSNRIVEACKGHPLSLEVIGAFLYDKHNDRECWTEVFHSITLHPDIHERLKISYSALTAEEKEIFLDIACFFVGEDIALPIVFWKYLYKMVHTAISNLSLKLLIKVDDKGVFDMHDHLQDMGRTIAEKEGTRLWDADHLSTVCNNINFSRLRLNGGDSQRLETLCRPGLQFLHMENLFIDTQVMLPSSLIWLRSKKCRFADPFHLSLVGNISQLRIMQVREPILSNFEYPLSNILGNLSQMRHLDLGECSELNNLPDTIGNLSQLQHLDLGECSELNNLPDIIGNLSQLQHLDLSWCKKLKDFPDTIGNLSQLQHLDLSWCKKLNNLPDTIGNLSQLQHLDLSWCKKLNNLPDTIGNLSQLQHLILKWCSELNNLPDTIGNLSQLQHLNLKGCSELNNLPDTIGNLSQLQHLYLRECSELNNLPDTIGNLSQLQHLDLSWCKKLNNLPDTIGNLSQLQHLDLSWCKKLNNLPDTIGNLHSCELFFRACGR